MKAIIFHETGDPDILKYEDVDDPVISEGDVIIDVKATTLNSVDLKLRSGKSPRPVDLPHIGGVDIAGEIVQTGEGVASVEVGDRVIVMPAVRSEKGVQIVGVNLYGGFAEKVKIPATNVIKIPDELSYDDASIIVTTYTTAWYALVERGNIQEGQTVLVHAAGSGTGSAAIQVAKYFNSYVIATAGSDEKLEKAKEIGADFTINYKTDDVSEKLKEATKEHKINLIFDPVGASMWKDNLQFLSPKGKLLLVGVSGGGIVESTSLGPIIIKDLDILGVTVFNAKPEHFKKVAELTAEGKLKPIIFRKLPLSEAAEGHKILENREQFGKVVLIP
ncbi:MAG: zinc-binding dehydrogenase [Candidatus Dadabacteria bacterium]|nr:zinc-binding dehydrogenase [Candidatus Dadabacteria bacterium]NIQ15465.1 zinc-binding dehydrogenase [Candidatus Dadabacteria bacterium]